MVDGLWNVSILIAPKRCLIYVKIVNKRILLHFLSQLSDIFVFVNGTEVGA